MPLLNLILQECEAKFQDRPLGLCIYVKITSFWVKILVKRSDPAKNIMREYTYH